MFGRSGWWRGKGLRSHLRPGTHGSTEAGSRRMRAFHRDEKKPGTRSRIERVREPPVAIQENSILHGHGMQLTGPDSQERAARRVRLLRGNFEASVRSLRLPELQHGREQVLLP